MNDNGYNMVDGNSHYSLKEMLPQLPSLVKTFIRTSMPLYVPFSQNFLYSH